MARPSIKDFAMQMIVIAALGLGAGMIDSARPSRQIKFGRETPPDPRAETRDPTPKPLPPGQITLDEAKRLFDSGASLVDARRKDDYEQGHIKGAMRINLKSFENGDPPLLAMIPRDGTVVVYCSGGNCDESEHVAEFLYNSGYKKVYVIHDGFPGWKAKGWPIETGEGLQ
jgi:rhodanese-related sulfurtransferase